MKSIKLYILFLLIPALTVAQTFTLEQSIETGLKNSKELKISQAKVIGSDAKITEVSSQMLPRLSLAASYTRFSSVPAFEIQTPIFPQPIKIQDAILNNYSVKLSLQQPLFTGFRLSSLKSAADYNYQAEELQYDSDVNKFALTIQIAFWNFYKDKEHLKLANENLQLIQKHLDETKEFFNNELVTKNDVLKMEVQSSNAELNLVDAKNNLDLARINFNKTIGIDLNSSSDIEIPDISSDKNDYDPDQLLEEAKQKRNELKSAEYRLKASTEGVTAATSNWFPNVYLFGDVYYNRPNQRYQPLEDKFNDSWDAGVSLSWDLWNWGYNSSQTTQAEQLKVQTESNLELLNDAVEVEVYRTYLNYSKAYDRITISKKAVEQADENYRTTKEKYEAQIATSTDLIDAEVSLLQAKTNLTNALADFQVTKIQLEKAVGRRIY